MDKADREMSNQIDYAMTASNTNFGSSVDNDMMGNLTKRKYGDLPLDTNCKFNLTVVN